MLAFRHRSNRSILLDSHPVPALGRFFKKHFLGESKEPSDPAPQPCRRPEFARLNATVVRGADPYALGGLRRFPVSQHPVVP